MKLNSKIAPKLKSKYSDSNYHKYTCGKVLEVVGSIAQDYKLTDTNFSSVATNQGMSKSHNSLNMDHVAHRAVQMQKQLLPKNLHKQIE